MDLRTGDTIITHSGTYIIVSAEGFNLFNDDGEKVNVILVDARNGSMVSCDHSLDDIQNYYTIKEVIPNPQSHERLNLFSKA